MSGEKKETIDKNDIVAQDKIWRSVINNETNFQNNWQKDWGFLAVEYSKINAFYFLLRH